MANPFTKAILGQTANVSYVHRDAHGNIVPLFAENRVGRSLLRLFRSLVPEPIDEQGHVKPGLGNYLAAYGLQIPFVTGLFVMEKSVANKIVNAGLALSAGLLNGSGSPTTPTYIAVGTGTTAVAATDTALVTETATSGLSRAAATVSLVTTTVTNDTAQWLKSFSVTGSVAVTESGVFNAASVGTMLCRQVFSAVNVANGDTLQITWKDACTSVN